MPADLVTAHHGLAAVDLARAVLQTAALQGTRAGLMAADSALHRSESPGETWTRLLFHELGLTGLEPQVELRDVEGLPVARVDFLDRQHGLVVEFDGAMKYAGGGTGQAAIVAEKRREDAIRRLGYRVLRLVWSDLLDPARVYRLVREARLTRV